MLYIIRLESDVNSYFSLKLHSPIFIYWPHIWIIIRTRLLEDYVYACKHQKCRAACTFLQSKFHIYYLVGQINRHLHVKIWPNSIPPQFERITKNINNRDPSLTIMHPEWPKHFVKPVLSGHSKADKSKVFKANGSWMKVESIAECSLGAFCNTFNLHKGIIRLENQFLVFFLSGHWRQVLLYFDHSECKMVEKAQLQYLQLESIWALAWGKQFSTSLTR